MTIQLLHPLPSVQKDMLHSSGGNQAWSHNRNFQLCGCGVVACLDLLIYLSRHHSGCEARALSPFASEEPVPLPLYDQTALSLSRRFLPLIPRLGLNGLSLASGFNLFCLRQHIPYRAHWGVSAKNFWQTIRTQLQKDIPVILSIGPNFPLFWQKNALVLYQKNEKGGYRRAADAIAHYVTVTGMDDDWLQISSWGRVFYINRDEYQRYIKAHSNRIVSNILCVERKEQT